MTTINLTGKISSPVVGRHYRLKQIVSGFSDIIFGRFLYKSDGSYSEDSGSGTTDDVDIATELAALTGLKDGDQIFITGITYVLNSPTNRGILYSSTLVSGSHFHCGTT